MITQEQADYIVGKFENLNNNPAHYKIFGIVEIKQIIDLCVMPSNNKGCDYEGYAE